MDRKCTRSSHTNAATMSQSSAFMPEAMFIRRKCKRKATEMHASAMKMALVAIMALEAEVGILENSMISPQSREKRCMMRSIIQK